MDLGRLVPDQHVLPAGPLKRLCVHRNSLRGHVTNQTDGPSVMIVTDDGQLLASNVEIHGPSRFVQSYQCPLGDTGAHVWVETNAEVAYC